MAPRRFEEVLREFAYRCDGQLLNCGRAIMGVIRQAVGPSSGESLMSTINSTRLRWPALLLLCLLTSARASHAADSRIALSPSPQTRTIQLEAVPEARDVATAGSTDPNASITAPPTPPESPASANKSSPAPPAGASRPSGTFGSNFGWIAEHRVAATVFAVVVAFIVVVIAGLLIATARSGKSRIATLPSAFFFWLGIGYLLLLLTVGAFYVTVYTGGSPVLLGGVLPVGVPWFGALGAVIISLEGIFAYGQKSWDPSYNFWHVGRPFFGAVLGIVAFFTYVLIIISSGTVPPFLLGQPPTSAPKDYIIYYVVAFLVGYREETFRELIRRVTDLILKPGTSAPATPAITFTRNGIATTTLDFGATTAGAPVSMSLDIENTGRGTLKTPNAALDNSLTPQFAIVANSLSGSTELKPGEAKSITIKFSPANTGSYAGALTVTGSNLGTIAKLPLMGRA